MKCASCSVALTPKEIQDDKEYKRVGEPSSLCTSCRTEICRPGAVDGDCVFDYGSLGTGWSFLPASWGY